MLCRGLAVVIAVLLIGWAGLLACRRSEPSDTGGTAAPSNGRAGTQAASADAPADTTTTQTDHTPDAATEEPHATEQGSGAQSGGDTSQPGAVPRASQTPPDGNRALSPGNAATEEDRLEQEARAALSDVEWRMLQRWGQLRSLSGTINTTFARTTHPMTDQQGKGTYECLKRGGRLLVRSFHFNAMAGENENEDIPWVVTGERYTKVSDGQFVYTVRESREVTTATKAFARYPHLLAVGGPQLFYLLRSLTDLRQRPNVEIDGRDVVVFEGKPPGEDPRLFRLFLDVEAGILRRMTIERPAAESRFALNLSEVSFDVDFEDDHFTFTPPDGVEVKDLTRPGPAGSSVVPDSAPNPAPGPDSAPAAEDEGT